MNKWDAPGRFAWVTALFIAVALAACAQASAARADTSIQILATDPVSPAEFGQWADFALRIGYDSTQPIVVTAEPIYEGRPVPPIKGGEAHVAAGHGEILLWFTYTTPQRIDAVTVIARSATGKFLTQTNWPIELTWSSRPAAPRPRADWVQRLKAEGEKRAKMQSEALYNSPMMGAMDAVAKAIILLVPGYFLLQIVLLWRLRGSWRKAAAAPLLPMGAILAYTIYAVMDGSNIAPVVLVPTAPLAFVYLAIIAWLTRIRNGPAVSA